MPSRYPWIPPERNTEDPDRPPLPGLERKAPRIHPKHPGFHNAGDEETWGHLAHPSLQRHNPFLRHPEAHDDSEPGQGSHWAQEYGGHADRWEDDYEETPGASPDKVERHLRRTVDKALPAVAVTEHSLHQILHSGRMKSQFETHTSGGALAPETRASVEHQFFGYPHDLPHHARPIYGYLTHDPSVHHNAIASYGEHALVLHRPRTWHRTSVFVGDTLDQRHEGHMAHPAQDFRLSGFPRHEDPKTWKLDHRDYGSEIPYTEAHFHGGVGLRDIHYAVLHTHSGMYGGYPDTDDMERALDKHRIPWVRMKKGQPEEWRHHLSSINRAVARGAFSMPDSQVIGHQNHERYLIDLGYDNHHGHRQAQVADIKLGKLYRPMSKDSLLARGYWEDPKHPVDLDDILPHVLPV